ncbi:MAG: hypothetical protein A3H97_20345 [Acidobacteria bacterium RIFCSPLOWO2_02_FULL_65_29]|nr:MAG: hypothetical protein A3H97_20345 [Acidobacteria bacterium RIFCSPLOWO2_02_FULL_65_29]
MDVPLPWERQLWSARAWIAPWRRYVLTDMRLVVIDDERSDEIALQDMSEIHRSESWLDRAAGTSTLNIERRGSRSSPLVLRGVRRGAQLAALLELLATDPRASIDDVAVREALRWEPQRVDRGLRNGVAMLAAAPVALLAAAITFGGDVEAISYPADDAIYPAGRKRDREAIVQFMETAVMPWARRALAPVAGGEDRVTCATCHGTGAPSRDWRMPSVGRLPEPQFRQIGWDGYGAGVGMDAQMRNALYGYLAESDKQAKAAYMREVVVPGMARLLHRPPYDFTRSYEYNRTRFAIGCYHCHRVN